jgi:2-keto-4-pentenoate hydratase/2-oxohepta-3-ene-1,7-dioic acid hydratase in catechol pathway
MKTLAILGRDERWAVGTIYCLGRNYREHAAEMGARDAPPVVFLKPGAAAVEPPDLVLPSGRGAVHHEIELVLALRMEPGHVPGKLLDAIEADRAIAGFTVGLDLTLREVQGEAKRMGSPWAASKGFAGSAPLGPIVLRLPEHRFDEMRLRLEVNGSVRQSAGIREMVRSPAAIVADLSAIFPLDTGDLVFTGTPAGVGPLGTGDRIAAHLEPILAVQYRVLEGDRRA